MSEWQAARDAIGGDSWIDDLARASVSAAEAKLGPVRPAGPITGPHDATACYRSRLHCIVHGTDEPDQPCYQACLECRHVYATAGELLDAHNAVADSAGEPRLTDAAKIFSCAHCSHDF